MTPITQEHNWPSFKDPVLYPKINFKGISNAAPLSTKLLISFSEHIHGGYVSVSDDGNLISIFNDGSNLIHESILYYFFDQNNLGVFIDLNDESKKYTYSIKSKKISKQFPDQFETRAQAQKSGFEMAFNYLEDYLEKLAAKQVSETPNLPLSAASTGAEGGVALEESRGGAEEIPLPTEDQIRTLDWRNFEKWPEVGKSIMIYNVNTQALCKPFVFEALDIDFDTQNHFWAYWPAQQ